MIVPASSDGHGFQQRAAPSWRCPFFVGTEVGCGEAELGDLCEKWTQGRMAQDSIKAIERYGVEL